MFTLILIKKLPNHITFIQFEYYLNLVNHTALISAAHVTQKSSVRSVMTLIKRYQHCFKSRPGLLNYKSCRQQGAAARKKLKGRQKLAQYRRRNSKQTGSRLPCVSRSINSENNQFALSGYCGYRGSELYGDSSL